MTLIEQLAGMGRKEQESVLSSLGWPAVDAWCLTARDKQVFPDAPTVAYVAGRGAGKTRAGVEWLLDAVCDGETWLAVAAPTFSDLRGTIVEGESGLEVCAQRRGLKFETNWNNRECRIGKARIRLLAASSPERMRGPQFERLLCDELGAWHPAIAMEAWSNLQFALRLGKARCLITSTPRTTQLFKHIMESAEPPLVIHETTFDNAANLSREALRSMEARYGGTSLGRQELMGEFIEASGAMFQRDWFQRCDVLSKRDTQHRDLLRTVVSVDPAVTTGDKSDLTGIIVMGLDTAGVVHLLADLSGRHTPVATGCIVRDAAAKYSAEVLVESNQGGDYLGAAWDLSYPPHYVTARGSKQERATPLALAYEQGRVRHCTGLDDYEAQLITWEPDDKRSKSPDRLDAAAHGFSFLTSGPRGFVGLVTASR